MKKILIFLFVACIAMQLIPIDFTNPEKGIEKDFFTINAADPTIKQIIQSSCYDCHSNETKYPYYTKIAPVNFWLKNHIDEGREHLNFSEWADYSVEKREHKLAECVHEIKEGKMPLKSYTWMHKEANLTDEQNAALIAFFKGAK